MHQDLNLNAKHKEFIKNKLGRAVEKFLRKREKTQRKKDKALKRAIKAELLISCDPNLKLMQPSLKPMQLFR